MKLSEHEGLALTTELICNHQVALEIYSKFSQLLVLILNVFQNGVHWISTVDRSVENKTILAEADPSKRLNCSKEHCNALTTLASFLKYSNITRCCRLPSDFHVQQPTVELVLWTLLIHIFHHLISIRSRACCPWRKKLFSFVKIFLFETFIFFIPLK